MFTNIMTKLNLEIKIISQFPTDGTPHSLCQDDTQTMELVDG